MRRKGRLGVVVALLAALGCGVQAESAPVPLTERMTTPPSTSPPLPSTPTQQVDPTVPPATSTTPSQPVPQPSPTATATASPRTG